MGTVILKGVLKREDAMEWTGLIWLRIGSDGRYL
jgi:hypothetical protein